MQVNKPLVDKIQKYEAEEFCGKVEDDPKKVEFLLENTTRVFDELSCTPNDCLKYAVSLLKDKAYQWWNTLVAMVSKDRVN